MSRFNYGISVRILKCTNLKELAQFLSPTTTVSIKCEILRTAANILSNNPKQEKSQAILNLFTEVSEQIPEFQLRDLLSFIYFFRVVRDQKNYYSSTPFQRNLLKKARDMVINNRALETAEIISAYYDLRRIKVFTWELDECIVNLLKNRNVPINIVQLTILIKVALNCITIYNLEIIKYCVQRILEIDFFFHLNSVILQIIEVIFEVNYKLHFCDTEELFKKIVDYLRIFEIYENDYLAIIQMHLKYSQNTIILDIVIKKFLDNHGDTCKNVELLAYVLHVLTRDSFRQGENFDKLVLNCAEIVKKDEKYSKNHFSIIKNLSEFKHLLPASLLSIFSYETIKDKVNFQDLLYSSYVSALFARNPEGVKLKIKDLEESEDIHEILKSYIILNVNQVFDLVPDLELAYKKLINKKIRSSNKENQAFISFLSKPLSASIRKVLQDIIIENLENILYYHENTFSLVRTLMALYIDHPKWYEQADKIIAERQSEDVLKFVKFSHSTANTINGLTYISKKMLKQHPLSLIQIIHLWMHPSLFSIDN